MLISLYYSLYMILNPFASCRLMKESYNYESNFLCNMRMNDVLAVIEKGCDQCPRCLIRKRNHYCIQPKCQNKQLICTQCDLNKISQKHFMHDYTYIMPLFSKDIFSSFDRLKRRITSYHVDILEEINKLNQYTEQLKKIEKIIKSKIEGLQNQEEKGKINQYKRMICQLLKGNKQNVALKNVLDNVCFKLSQQCQRKDDEIKDEVIVLLNNLKWLKDPQKVLKDKLQKSTVQEQKKQVFISSKRPLQISQIDNSFRISQQFYTSNLQNHRIELKLEADYISKLRIYQSLIYHFRNCKKLMIDGGTINHLKTPIGFRKLKELQFNFNVELDSPNIKIQNIQSDITAIVFKRVRQQDLKPLKIVFSSLPFLKKVHFQFGNKTDLSNNKDLIESLQNLQNMELVSFTFKIRTQSEVKRQYGYLSKFYKQNSLNEAISLGQSITQILETNKFLTKVVIEGVRPFNMHVVLSKLKKLSFLMDYKVYYENIDLMTEVDQKDMKQLENKCYQRKRMFYALAKAAKQKNYPRTIINRVVQEMFV